MKIKSTTKYSWLQITIECGPASLEEVMYSTKKNIELKQLISDLSDCLDDAKTLLERTEK